MMRFGIPEYRLPRTLIRAEIAFGAAALAFLRFTRGPCGAAVLLVLSLFFWIAAPALAAIEGLHRTDV